MVVGIQSFIGKVKYSLYLFLWVILYHEPVLFYLEDYFTVLFWRTSARGGITYSRFIEILASPLGIGSIPTILWLLALMTAALVLISEVKLHLLDKFAIIIMVNNLFEPRGGIGHIATALPIIAIYYLVRSDNKREIQFFWIYIIISTVWGFDRIMFNFKENSIVKSSGTVLMVIITTILYIIYLRGLYMKGHLQFSFTSLWKKDFTNIK